MDNDTNDALPGQEHESDPPSGRRPYETPRITVYGDLARLTRDPQSRPRGTSQVLDTKALFLGDNA
jgi:hypothetical protein